MLKTAGETARSVLVIVGTTGVGKSQLSIDLATRFNGEIINADSMQMYKGADTITNKHPVAEREGVPHHVMDHTDWTEEYFIHRFNTEATQAIADIHQRGKLPIIVGGTHYYLTSLLFTNKTIPTGGSQAPGGSIGGNSETSGGHHSDLGGLSPEQQAQLELPPQQVFQLLQQHDPAVAQKFHPNDSRRVRRALEIYFKTHTTASEHYQQQSRNRATQSSLRYNTLFFWVYADKQVLNQRLDDRVDSMLAGKALDEISQLYTTFSRIPEPQRDVERGIWQVIGFKEFLPWLQSHSDSDYAQSVRAMKTRTRQYAKRQIKWIRNSLAVDLRKESQHNYVNGGRLFILDSTDLASWRENVLKRGELITSQFLNGEQFTLPQAPQHLENLLPSTDTAAAHPQWKHYKCETCFDSSTNDHLVLVGETQWKAHLKSKRHSTNLNRGKKKRAYEEWLKSQQHS